MKFLDLLFISVGLAMDAFAVSLTSGFIIKNLKFKNSLKIGLFFGFFQFIMPVIGWLAGINFSKYVEAYSHWVAFILLGFIGIKMIYEALKHKESSDIQDTRDPLDNKILFFLAVATSIDALAVGVTAAASGAPFLTFNPENLPIVIASIIIGIITLIISISGVYLGKKFGSLFQKQAEIAGGIILILIGLKIFIQHYIS